MQITDRQLRSIVQAHLQHYAEPTVDPTPAASAIQNNTILPLAQGILTHNTAGVPIIVACTKADQIDEGNDIMGAGTSGMGGMVKGKGGEWEERTDGVMQVLRTICLKCKSVPWISCQVIQKHGDQMAQHYSTQPRCRTPYKCCGNTLCTFFSLLSRHHLGCKQLTARRQCATRFHSSTNPILLIATASLFPLDGTAGARLRFSEMGSMRKRGVKLGNMTSNTKRESPKKVVHERCTARWYPIKASR